MSYFHRNILSANKPTPMAMKYFANDILLINRNIFDIIYYFKNDRSARCQPFGGDWLSISLLDD